MTPDRNAASPPGIPKGVRVLGIGTDIVHIPDLAQQIGTVGSRFAEPGVVFTAARNRAQPKKATVSQTTWRQYGQLRKLRSKPGLRRSKPRGHPSHFQSTEWCGPKSS